MNHYGISRFFKGVLVFACLAPSAAPQQIESDASIPQPSAAQEAVSVVLGQAKIDPNVIIGKTGRPLATDGKWSVSKVSPQLCPKTDNPCVRVLYKLQDAGVSCEWTVLLLGTIEKSLILDLSDDAALYFTNHETFHYTIPKHLNPEPRIPPQIVKASGRVKMLVQVAASGHVDNVTVISGSNLFREYTATIAKQVMYDPLFVDGVAIPHRTTLTLVQKIEPAK